MHCTIINCLFFFLILVKSYSSIFSCHSGGFSSPPLFYLDSIFGISPDLHHLNHDLILLNLLCQFVPLMKLFFYSFVIEIYLWVVNWLRNISINFDSRFKLVDRLWLLLLCCSTLILLSCSHVISIYVFFTRYSNLLAFLAL